MDTIRDLILSVLFFIQIVLFAQVVMSWLVVAGVKSDVVTRLYFALSALTQPILEPIRRVLPRTGTFDFSVLAAFLLIFIIRRAVIAVL